MNLQKRCLNHARFPNCTSVSVIMQPHGGDMAYSMTLILYRGIKMFSSSFFKPRRISLDTELRHKLRTPRELKILLHNQKVLVNQHHWKLVKQINRIGGLVKQKQFLWEAWTEKKGNQYYTVDQECFEVILWSRERRERQICCISLGEGQKKRL